MFIITCHPFWPCTETTQVKAKSQTKERQTVKPRRRQKTMNLDTYKIHSLGDYVDTIRHYGTTDSFSTELVRYFININPIA